jgi:putative endonuclease
VRVETRAKGICVYIIQCSDGTLYTGWTTDLRERLKAHNAGSGAKYTRGRTPVTLLYAEPAETRGKALQRECQIKKMTRKQKLGLAAWDSRQNQTE